MMRVLALIGLLLTATAQGEPIWHWEDRFSSDEQEKLSQWVRHAHDGLVTLFGPLPYDYDVHFHRRSDRGEPVPWANTSKRGGRDAVHFYVDTKYSLSKFKADWTAYHELTHLMFPYLGKRGRWFAEGIASYFQYQVMYAADELDWSRVMARYRDRYAAATRSSRHDDISIAHLSRNARGAAVRLYWGGSAYFMAVDRTLKEQHDQRLHDVIRRYLDCCYGDRGGGAMGMIRTFDRISGTDVFSTVYQDTVKQEGFPATAEGLRWLADHPPAMPASRTAP